MVLKLEKIRKFSLALLLIVPSVVQSIEANMLLITFMFFFVIVDFKSKYSITMIKIISTLIFILGIALISTFLYPSAPLDIVKDIFFLSNPFIYIIMGYYFIKNIKDKSFIFKIIIQLALLFAIIHLFKSFSFLLNNDFNINKLRNYAGRGNVVEIFAIVILLSKKGRQLYTVKSKYRKTIVIIIITSFIFYFSRKTTVSVVILLLALNEFLKISSKAVIYMFGFIAVITMFYIYLFSVDIKRGADGFEGFLYKMKIAPSEIFDSDINEKDHKDLWDHWRAYEAKKAIEQLESTPFATGLITGKGVGSLVDLEFVAPLSKDGIQYITTLHNGYTYILYKSGLLGLLSFFLFLMLLYGQVYIQTKNNKRRIINSLLSGMAIYYMFTTLIVSGVYNPRDFSGIFVGALLYLQHYYKKQESQKLKLVS
jgi:O-antigen ligase|nr:O-antigen ligase family protein [uncultured Psychroserpens sp.]